jgi:hypothetical protein
MPLPGLRKLMGLKVVVCIVFKGEALIVARAPGIVRVIDTCCYFIKLFPYIDRMSFASA